MSQHFESLINAINSYDFPLECYDFPNSRPVVGVKTYAELEGIIGNQLLSNDFNIVKDGLSNVLYWGYSTSAGRRNDRVARFRSEVSNLKLNQFIELRDSSSGLSLSGIKDIGLPQFSKVSFVSKILMFFDPERFVVLDLQLAKIKQEKSSVLFQALVRHQTCLPINAANTEFYRQWCSFCSNVSGDLQEFGFRPVDIERGIFTIVKRQSPAKAAKLIESLRTITHSAH